jgi:hypothetical protein
MIAEVTGKDYVASGTWGCYLSALVRQIFTPHSLSTLETLESWRWRFEKYIKLYVPVEFFKLYSLLVVSDSLMCGHPYSKTLFPTLLLTVPNIASKDFVSNEIQMPRKVTKKRCLLITCALEWTEVDQFRLWEWCARDEMLEHRICDKYSNSKKPWTCQ